MSNPMTSELDKIRSRLAKIEEEIAETKKRLPAHSIKPPVMMDLLTLEDERDMLQVKLRAYRGK